MRLFYKTIISAFFIIFCAIGGLQAQAIVLNAPVAADNPNLPGNSPWPAICAGNNGFNEYFVNITWAGTANAGNEFILELSDSDGAFGSPTTLATVTDQNTNSDFDIGFSVPNTIRGNGYTMRVRSTNPEKTSPVSNAYNMYYMDVTKNINISELGDGVPPGSICSTSAVTLQVDNVTNPETYQYIWYRSGTEISGQRGHTLLANQSGIYTAVVDYGAICTGSGNTDSNSIDVVIGGAGLGIAIRPPTKTALCSGDTETLAIDSTDPSWNYRWYKNNIAIPGATGTSYTVNASNADFEGDYTVEISAPGLCTERAEAIRITNADSFTVTRDNVANMVVLPLQPQTLSVTTTANGPTYKWFRNNVEITGETGNSLTVTQEGTYYAQVSQTNGACANSVKNADPTNIVTPTSFEIVLDYGSDYVSCEQTSTTLTIKSINAVANDGTKTEVTTMLKDAFTYQWRKDGQEVAGQTGSTISIANNEENGEYIANAVLGTYNAASNRLPVQLRSSETLSITSTGTVFCSASDNITISTDKDLTTALFEWQKDGEVLQAQTSTLAITETGTYQLVLLQGSCTLPSNEIVISPLDENLITIDPAGDVVLPEGTSRTVTASGGTAYRWMNEANVAMSTSESITVTEAGTYTLIANIGNCEVTKLVNVEILDTFKIPNVITPNADGINDLWVIPNSYSNKQEVTVTIYNEQGQEMLNEADYKNNWPQSSMAFSRQNMVFYYKIRTANEVLKQGTITVIR